MGNKIYKALHRLALLLAAVALCAMTPAAQDTRPAPNAANTPAGGAIPTTAPNLNAAGKAPMTPPKGKLRGTTNTMRWQAAARTADRKTKANGKMANSGGGKQ